MAFLASGAGIKRIDTHISIVFLGADRVLKVKRAVKSPFSKSTLERRRQTCEEELAVNAPNAPSIYRRVVPITRGTSGLEIGGKGPAIEWAVEMARFDESRTLDHLAAAHALPAGVAEALAETMHASQARAPASDGAEWLRLDRIDHR